MLTLHFTRQSTNKHWYIYEKVLKSQGRLVDLDLCDCRKANCTLENI